MRLSEIGERKLTEQHLPKVCLAAGDDCGYLELGDSDIVVTTDPVPAPASEVIAGDSDRYWAGRLLVTINASDLAAAGAKPLGFVAAIECPSDMYIESLDRLIKGIADGCQEEGLHYVGGNLKESTSFAATGTAIGYVPKGMGLHRKGACPGDFLYSVGQGGVFWRDVFRWKSGERFEKTRSKLFSPRSQLHAMQLLRQYSQISCSMDNSDGLLSTLEQLSRINNMMIYVDSDNLSVPDVHDPVNAIRYWLGWGDWTVVVAISPTESPRFEKIARENDFTVVQIGKFVAGTPSVFLKSKNGMHAAPRLESERFAADSWFSEGIDGYITRLTGLRVS